MDEEAKLHLLNKRRSSALAVPTNDNAVRARLRRLSHSITLFGKSEMERRDRLRSIFSTLLPSQLDSDDDFEQQQEVKYPFFIEATRPEALRDARISIAQFSVPRAMLSVYAAAGFDALARVLGHPQWYKYTYT